MKFGLTTKELRTVTDYLSKINGLEKVLIFGSRARGDNKMYSDIDLCLFSQKEVVLWPSIIKAELNQLTIPYLFDVVNWSDINSEKLKERIKRDGEIIWENT